LFYASAAIALALALGSAGPPPPTGTRCAELVIDEEYVTSRRATFVQAFTVWASNAATEPAVPAMLAFMQAIAPQCEWTPSTTTDITGLDGKHRRFDQIMRDLQGKTVAEASAALEMKSPGDLEGLTGMTAPEIAIGGRLPRVAPPVPTPDLPPKEGEGASPPPPPAACDRTLPDGDASICLRRLPSGQWSWTWTGADGTVLEGEQPNRSDAAIVAYQAGSEKPVGFVVEAPVVRAGTRLDRSGHLALLDGVTWGTSVYNRLRSQWTQNERDPMGLVLAALQTTFPGVNWFRIKLPLGGLPGAAARVKKVVDTQANAPDVVDRIARAIVASSYDQMRHVFRGRLVELRANDQGWYAYRVDGGPWTGAYMKLEDAIAAAHGG